MQTIDVSKTSIGPGSPLAIIAGPCLAESLDLCLEVATAMRDCCAKLGLGYIFKASFDKANRSSIGSGRGPGLDEALEWFARISNDVGVPVTTDIHEPAQAAAVGNVVDMIQIPAFLCRQTDLLVAAAETGKPVNAKKGQFISPAEMRNVVGKLTDACSGKTSQIMLTERGTFFGYGRLVNDFAGLADMMALGWPVCFDVTHSTQQPGEAEGGKATGGRPQAAPILARCAVAAGVQALFLETHPQPNKAMCDASVMLPLKSMPDLLADLAHLHAAVRAQPSCD